MDERILAISEELQKKYGLDQYVLKHHHIFAEKSLDHTTNYILSLEWFPTESGESQADFNPNGSAVIDVDFHTHELKRLIFVGDKSYANEGIFPTPETENVIEWVEETTGMLFGRQFRLVYEDGGEFSFQATVDNIEVAPTGHIDLSYNESNQLTQFSIDGVFPTEAEIDWEPFSLTKEDITEKIKGNCTLVDIPDELEEKWLSVWQIQSFYIRNDQSEVILPDTIGTIPLYRKLHYILQWDIPSTKVFQAEEVDLSPETTLEDAEAQVQIKPITEVEMEKCLEETKNVLSSIYPLDSGKWTVAGMHPEKNYIFVEIQGDSFKALKRKIKLIIDRTTFQALNYTDNQIVLDHFSHYENPEETSVLKEEAFDKLWKHIQVTPVYVKDTDSETYRICGRVDCEVVVDAATGALINGYDL